MATYKELTKQIQALQAKAEKLRQAELAEVVTRIKTAIAHYGLTAAHLGLSGGPAKGKGKGKAQKAASGTLYRDEAGRTWGGRGPRPLWLREAIAAGRALESFVVAGAAAAVSAPKAKASKGKGRAVSKAKAKARPTYRDEKGNRWTGMGPQPKWLKEALAAGKTLEELAA